MDECQNLESCNFFKMFKNDQSKHLALKGFVFMFCTGRKQNECVRKKISQILGGSQFVPPNMLPNGFAMAGTNKANWSAEVLNLL